MSWRFLGIATDIQQLVESGQHCYSCGVLFVKAHGYRALCRDCWSWTKPPERDGAVKAVHDDVDVAHAKNNVYAKRALRKSCPNDTLDDSP